jgi:hypothetical protein
VVTGKVTSSLVWFFDSIKYKVKAPTEVKQLDVEELPEL